MLKAGIPICLIFLTVAAGAVPALAQEEQADSTRAPLWSAVYVNRIELMRESEPFPWNDPLESTHINDRLSAAVLYRPWRNLQVFLKGATGQRKVEGEIFPDRFYLAQGHIQYAPERLPLKIRCFTRERVFDSRYQLLTLTSNDSPLLAGRGEGMRADLFDGSIFHLSYTAAMLRETGPFDERGGFPELRGGGDTFQLLSLRAGRQRIWKVGISLSQVRSLSSGDAALLGTEASVRVIGIRLTAALARSSPGKLADLRDKSLWGVSLSPGGGKGPSAVFSENAAFAAELQGLNRASSRWGRMGVIPGYRFSGEKFINLQGETETGLVESKVTAWWRHYDRAAMVSLDLGNRFERAWGKDFDYLAGTLRMNYRGGLEAIERIILREGYRPAWVLSFSDESDLARLRATARLDQAEGRNRFFFLADGSMNLSNSWTARCVLFMQNRSSSLYHLGLEFRPGRRFIFSALCGSFLPRAEGIALEYDPSPPEREKDRMILITTRVWLGELRK
ncbi:MAG: hypothetical protein JXB45_08305 [Candidatus Krumholzibacteriota bacterium]|nr:hypothetical protein [Candidatus Krumholzibacteriota bacterium]